MANRRGPPRDNWQSEPALRRPNKTRRRGLLRMDKAIRDLLFCHYSDRAASSSYVPISRRFRRPPDAVSGHKTWRPVKQEARDAGVAAIVQWSIQTDRIAPRLGRGKARRPQKWAAPPCRKQVDARNGDRPAIYGEASNDFIDRTGGLWRGRGAQAPRRRRI